MIVRDGWDVVPCPITAAPWWRRQRRHGRRCRTRALGRRLLRSKHIVREAANVARRPIMADPKVTLVCALRENFLGPALAAPKFRRGLPHHLSVVADVLPVFGAVVAACWRAIRELDLIVPFFHSGFASGSWPPPCNVFTEHSHASQCPVRIRRVIEFPLGRPFQRIFSYGCIPGHLRSAMHATDKIVPVEDLRHFSGNNVMARLQKMYSVSLFQHCIAIWKHYKCYGNGYLNHASH
mmetsp:Transcript_45514/g.90157  ORF Transcript_45514/g.90157 Transcript_45514/m.90157 type:complete len:237 (+) Transcript_45514:157-867(+)